MTQPPQPPQPPYGQQPFQQQVPPPYPPQPYPPQPYPPYPPGRAPLSPQDERLWATLAHLSPFVGGFVGLPVLGPLVVYLMYKDRSPFVRRHAANALNFQIVLMIATLVGVLAAVVVGVLTLGIGLLVVVPVAIAVGIGALVLQVVAAVTANRGEPYEYPLTPRLVS